ncbi:MAG: hypothetical protein LAT55_08905 [Opitutales bacterium]|nr:hypothetical protein [Opitutales bacterium]
MQYWKNTRLSLALFFASVFFLAASGSLALAEDEDGESGDGEDHGSVIQIS